ncbi:hypothetical protein NMY22_g15621 [Coprinellus aureogranulatus]|nr:hypothetical protein NMY22_g15621 [Coprinellus aureogranulatus]
MRTRSGKVLANSRSLQAQSTLTEVTVSLTGQGTHTRWIRPPEARQEQAFTSPPVSTARTGGRLNIFGLPMSTPNMPDRDVDLSIYITPDPWKPTSPPRPSPLDRRVTKARNNDGSPELTPTVGSLGNLAHERLQQSLARNGAKGDKPRGRPLVGPTGTFTQTPHASPTGPKGVKFAGEPGPLPPLVLGSPLGSPYDSQPENAPLPLRRSTRSQSPSRRRDFK